MRWLLVDDPVRGRRLVRAQPKPYRLNAQQKKRKRLREEELDWREAMRRPLFRDPPPPAFPRVLGCGPDGTEAPMEHWAKLAAIIAPRRKVLAGWSTPREITGREHRLSPGTIVINRAMSTLTGEDLKQRLQALQMSMRRFASRSGMAYRAIYHLSRQPSGRIPIQIVRLVELEELLAELATALDNPTHLRRNVAVLLDRQATRM